MFAKQTMASASLGLVVALASMAGIAQADPDPNASATGSNGATGKFQVGAGYGTDEGFFATAMVSQSNLFGTGDGLSIVSALSALHQLVRLDFVQPHIFDSDATLDTQLYDDDRLLPGFTREAAGATVTASEQLGDHVRAYVGYRLEHVLGEATAAAQQQPDERGLYGAPPLGDDLISALRAGIEYDSRDSRYLPRHGADFGVSVEYADPRLGSQLELATLHAWAGDHQPLGPVTLHVGGSLTTLASNTEIPLADRLWILGSPDVRGFQPGSFGPVDANGDPVGGTLELAGRASLELPLGRTGLSLEGFYDYARLADLQMPRGSGGVASATGRSVGFGVIWRSPLGPLRFDVALPLVHGASPVLVFGIGQAF